MTQETNELPTCREVADAVNRTYYVEKVIRADRERVLEEVLEWGGKMTMEELKARLLK